MPGWEIKHCLRPPTVGKIDCGKNVLQSSNFWSISVRKAACSRSSMTQHPGWARHVKACTSWVKDYQSSQYLQSTRQSDGLNVCFLADVECRREILPPSLNLWYDGFSVSRGTQDAWETPKHCRWTILSTKGGPALLHQAVVMISVARPWWA